MLFKSEESDNLQTLHSTVDPESLPRDDEDDLRHLILRVTAALFGSCRYCLMISTDIRDDAPIYCAKSNDLCYALKVDADCCLACGEYKKKTALGR